MKYCLVHAPMQVSIVMSRHILYFIRSIETFLLTFGEKIFYIIMKKLFLKLKDFYDCFPSGCDKISFFLLEHSPVLVYSLPLRDRLLTLEIRLYRLIHFAREYHCMCV